MPLVRRIPKRGFNNRLGRDGGRSSTSATWNAAFKAGEEVTPETLAAEGLVKGSYDVLKVLGNGELTKKLKISAHRFSRSATEKIEKAGGAGRRPARQEARW